MTATNRTGTIGGIMNWLSNLMGGVAPIVTGSIVSLTGSFSGAFPIASVVLLVGIFAYVVLLGEITPLPDREPSLAHDIAGAH
ncbi:MAG TPA: hypothetical protein VL614_01615 [Acetobacteraceae bacterium]|jgi:ACS family D-galactonate transporter-like MFS transporter|nr:hypothetical protein [Acetobacteraceae bacterium]